MRVLKKLLLALVITSTALLSPQATRITKAQTDCGQIKNYHVGVDSIRPAFITNIQVDISNKSARLCYGDKPANNAAYIMIWADPEVPGHYAQVGYGKCRPSEYPTYCPTSGHTERFIQESWSENGQDRFWSYWFNDPEPNTGPHTYSIDYSATQHAFYYCVSSGPCIWGHFDPVTGWRHWRDMHYEIASETWNAGDDFFGSTPWPQKFKNIIRKIDHGPWGHPDPTNVIVDVAETSYGCFEWLDEAYAFKIWTNRQTGC